MAPDGYITGTTSNNCKCTTNNTTCACSQSGYNYHFLNFPTSEENQEIIIPIVKIKHKFARNIKINFNNRWDVLLNKRSKILMSVRKGNR